MSSVFLTSAFSVDGIVPDLTAIVMCFCSTICLGWNEHIFLNEEHFPTFLGSDCGGKQVTTRN